MDSRMPWPANVKASLVGVIFRAGRFDNETRDVAPQHATLGLCGGGQGRHDPARPGEVPPPGLSPGRQARDASWRLHRGQGPAAGNGPGRAVTRRMARSTVGAGVVTAERCPVRRVAGRSDQALQPPAFDHPGSGTKGPNRRFREATARRLQGRHCAALASRFKG